MTKGIMTTGKYLTTVFASENDMTAKTNMWISHNYPFLRGMYLHIPNETPGEMKGGGHLWRILMAAMGVLPGVPDFMFEQVYVTKHETQYNTIPPNTLQHVIAGVPGFAWFIPGWYLELKSLGKKPSIVQGNLHEHWRAHGIRVEWTDNAAGVVELVSKTYGKPIY